MTSRIYTRTGDSGETDLLDGCRVPKDDVCVEAYGAVDELNSTLGLVLTLDPPADTIPFLKQIQSRLLELGSDLATHLENINLSSRLRDSDVVNLEATIDEFEARMPALASFILPNGTPAAAALHVSRSTCRRAERAIVTLRRKNKETPLLSIRFMNRLGDLLFVLARYANHVKGVPESPWTPRPKP